MSTPDPSATRDAAAVRFPPPLVPLIAIAAGVLIDLAGWPLAVPAPGWVRYGGGGLLILLGIGAMIAAIGLFRRTGQDPKPWESTPEIVSTGIYRFTRNPMYLGMGLLQAGIGVVLANLWIVLFVPISWLVIFWIAIRHEEAYLESKFGETYLRYKQRVRRWL
ncbi:MAG TPA: isoprenylcysteine carboxylmethyltransferase family protein [Myxococcota bacterium]|nr:isoprenylcysteine carboxylmethyltransferase family protein [Myxococcota bacterium]